MRSAFARCLAQVLGLAPHEVPLPGDGEDPVDAVRPWLAQRGLGLAEVGDTAAFAWPGPWVARLADGRFVLRFGVPSGTVDDPDGGPDAEVVAGWVVAPHVPRRWSAPPLPPPTPGVVEALLTAPDAEAPVVAHEAVTAVTGRGLEGDRYFAGTGTFGSGRPGSALTVVDAAALEAAGVSAEEARRNVVVRGTDLDALHGRRFRLGDAELLGQRHAEPCAHLARLAARPEVLRALAHRGGLRADVVRGGTVRVGDALEPLEGQARRP